MEQATTCCFTGHRPDKLPWGTDETAENCLMLKREIEQALDACVAPLLQIRDLIKDNPELDDAAIRQAYNASGKLPTVKVSVVTAMRAAINEGKI